MWPRLPVPLRLTKWLDTKLKPLSLNRYTVTDIFEFANEIRNLEIFRSQQLTYKIVYTCIDVISSEEDTTENT